MPLLPFTHHLDGAKRLVSPVKTPAFMAVFLRRGKFKPITRRRRYDGMVNANGNRCAGTCRNHLPVAPARVPLCLLKAARTRRWSAGTFCRRSGMSWAWHNREGGEPELAWQFLWREKSLCWQIPPRLGQHAGMEMKRIHEFLLPFVPQ